MPNAQEWLENQEEYNAKEKREKVKELDISGVDWKIGKEKKDWNKLEGDLDLSDFINLETLDCSHNAITNLNLNNCRQLKNISCGFNKLTNLDLTNLNHLERIECCDNYLKSFDYSSLNLDKLTYLNITDNNLLEQDLSVFSKFSNLEILWIGNSNKEHFQQNIYNKFYGSLEPLDGLGKLKSLHVSNTNIDSGLEYLLESVNEIYCSSEERPESKVEIIEMELKNSDKFFVSGDGYVRKTNPQEWLENNYPNKENTTEIVFDSDELELNLGELIIANYPNLEKIITWVEKGIKNITKVTIRNCPKLKEVNINNFVDSQQLEISECANLEMFRCGNNQLTELNLSQNKLLIEIVCAKNKLTQLTLPNQSDNLQKLICYENELTSLDFLKSCHLPKLESLVLNDNNFPPQDLEFFVPFRELKVLRIDGIDKPSYFTGSLKPLQELKKLEILNIGGTDITHGLEYLPESVKEIDCTPNRPNAKVSDIYEELQTFGNDLNKWRAVKLDKKPCLLTAPLVPLQLTKLTNKLEDKSTQFPEPKNKELCLLGKIILRNWNNLWNKESETEQERELRTEENYNTSAPSYEQIYFNHWKITNPLLPQESPTKLYQFGDDQVIITKEENTNSPYAILSYVWGTSHEKQTSKAGLPITNSASQAISKGISALAVINQELPNPINYLWVDQLCMNQEDQHEKSEEVSKMGKYYDNSALTLIAMDSEVGETNEVMEVLTKVVNSEWFQRSWCFQEGWLSKHTIFMFDDKLIDGYAMAGNWVLHQPSYIEGGKYLSWYEFNQGTKKIATPVGWTYYRDGYDATTDKVELTLTQALYAIKNRKRTEPLDGIYSILGLLPYGKDVTVDYSTNNTSEKALVEVMKVAIANGYAEPLSWHGESNNGEGLCCLPQIDKEGSASVMGSVGKVGSILKDVNGKTYELISFTDQGLEFDALMPHYTIHQTNQNTHKLESGFEIEGGLFRKEVVVKPREMEEVINLSLLGTKETLDLVQEGNLLVVLHKELFGTNKLFALLVKETNQTNTYHRLGLVELANSEGVKFATWADNFKGTIIGSNQYQAQIEIPPKK